MSDVVARSQKLQPDLDYLVVDYSIISDFQFSRRLEWQRPPMLAQVIMTLVLHIDPRLLLPVNHANVENLRSKTSMLSSSDAG